MSNENSAGPADSPADAVLSLSDLSISLPAEDGITRAAKRVNVTVRTGEIVAVVGESGAGKSVTFMAVLGLLPRTSDVSGTCRLNGVELDGMSKKDLRRVRGNDIAMVFQDPMAALNPAYTIGWQIREALLAHQDMTKRAAAARAVELLSRVGIPNPAKRMKQYPHQLSGGLQQRVVIAMAVANDPKVIIADEPTTALDVTVQAEILDLFRELRATSDTAIVLITHDMGVVADVADRVVVMYQGEIVEEAGVRELFANPQQEYTRDLLSAVPALGQGPKQSAARQPDEAAVLKIENLVVEYPGKGRRGATRAVDDVSLHIDEGEILGLVGESGSGKSTLGRSVVRLLKPTAGTVSVAGTDITNLSSNELQPLRRQFSTVFQDPASTLDPRMTIGDSIAEPLVVHRELSGADLERRVASLLARVELPSTYRDRYPSELSGGQRQRVSIARALALNPRVLVADEPTSALDVSVQAVILDLFLELQHSLRFACLFISHDLAVVDQLADRVAVMWQGKLVESGTREQVLHSPQHPYTRSLLSAALVADPVLQAARRNIEAD